MPRFESLSLTRVRVAVAFVLLTACSHKNEPARVVPSTVPAPRVAQVWPALTGGERRTLARELDSAFAGFGANVSLCVLDSGPAPAYDRSGSRALVPASTQKIIVASAALQALGAAYRFHTEFAASGAITDGTLDSDLWLVGSGDPVFVSNDLRGGIKRLASAGLRRIGGGVAVDASALSGPERNPLWDPNDANYGFSAATSGVSLDQDTIEFHFRPTSPGAPATVVLEPRARIVSYSGSVLTVPAGYATEITVNPAAREDTFVVAGQVAASARETVYYLPVTRIPKYVADVVETMLEARGIRTARSPRMGMAPRSVRPMWDHRSPPLQWIVSKMLFESNNHIAEQLLRTLGRAHSGTGDDEHGVAAELAFLHRERIPVDGLHLVDGSGLSDANRTSALTLATLLARAEKTPGGNQLYPALPRAGIEGSLRHYRFADALGRVRAKSGHLSGVDSLVGYVNTHRHGRMVFAFLLNGTGSRWTVDDAIARAVDRLADF